VAAIEYARRLRTEDQSTKDRFFLGEEEERLKRGEDVLDVLQSSLEGQITACLAPAIAKPNPLDEYRL